MGSGGPPHISSPRHFYYKIWWYFWSKKKCTRHHFNFFEKIGLLRVQRKFGGPNIFIRSLLFWWVFPEKLQSMCKICANMRNPEEKNRKYAKYAQICGNMRSTYSPPPCSWTGGPTDPPPNFVRGKTSNRFKTPPPMQNSRLLQWGVWNSEGCDWENFGGNTWIMNVRV